MWYYHIVPCKRQPVQSLTKEERRRTRTRTVPYRLRCENRAAILLSNATSFLSHSVYTISNPILMFPDFFPFILDYPKIMREVCMYVGGGFETTNRFAADKL